MRPGRLLDLSILVVFFIGAVIVTGWFLQLNAEYYAWNRRFPFEIEPLDKSVLRNLLWVPMLALWALVAAWVQRLMPTGGLFPDESRTRRELRFCVWRFLGLDNRTTARIGRASAGLALLSWVTLVALEVYTRMHLPSGLETPLLVMPYLEAPLIVVGLVSTVIALNW